MPPMDAAAAATARSTSSYQGREILPRERATFMHYHHGRHGCTDTEAMYAEWCVRPVPRGEKYGIPFVACECYEMNCLWI